MPVGVLDAGWLDAIIEPICYFGDYMRNDHLLNTLTESISTLFGFIGSIKNDKIVWEKGLGEITIYDHIYHLSNCQ